MQRDDYKLEELAEAADVSVRTVRYYVQRGLLAPPIFRGKDTMYSAGHLLRLKLIKKLQDERFMPLDAIAQQLEGLTDQEVAAMFDRSHKSPTVYPTDSPRSDGGPYRARVHRVASPKHERWTKIVLADGVELSVRDDTGWDTDALADRVRDALNKRR
jgi:DNA-binding transcriptional MerR regulator